MWITFEQSPMQDTTFKDEYNVGMKTHAQTRYEITSYKSNFSTILKTKSF